MFGLEFAMDSAPRMNTTYILTSPPIGALILSIFLGPLGIEGYVVDGRNKSYGSLPKHLKRLSIVKWVLWGIFIASVVIASATGEESVAVVSGVSWVCMSVVCITSIILVAMILARHRPRQVRI